MKPGWSGPRDRGAQSQRARRLQMLTHREPGYSALLAPVMVHWLDRPMRTDRLGRGRRQRILGEVELAVAVLRLAGRGERLQDVPMLLDLAVGHPEEVVERVGGASEAAFVDHKDEAALAD